MNIIFPQGRIDLRLGRVSEAEVGKCEPYAGVLGEATLTCAAGCALSEIRGKSKQPLQYYGYTGICSCHRFSAESRCQLIKATLLLCWYVFGT